FTGIKDRLKWVSVGMPTGTGGMNALPTPGIGWGCATGDVWVTRHQALPKRDNDALSTETQAGGRKINGEPEPASQPPIRSPGAPGPPWGRYHRENVVGQSLQVTRGVFVSFAHFTIACTSSTFLGHTTSQGFIGRTKL
ncbi:MAG TPA: hypothetical protein VEG28_02120, partial [Dehalococcoidia bacterium]|nr:hypothetical protein [Dehalococcoidia bacterium]